MAKKQTEPQRYLGLELAGAKNSKTTIVGLEFYPKEKKVFLLDVVDGVGGYAGLSGDDAVLEELRDWGKNVCALGTSAPLQLPPCLPCPRKTCKTLATCTLPANKWVKEMETKAKKRSKKDRAHYPSPRPFTPYTQRPTELWLRYEVIPEFPRLLQFEVDETLGGNKAPITARMTFLKRSLGDLPIFETLPKLTLAVLAPMLGIQNRYYSQYRKLDDGVFARSKILEAMTEQLGIFFYEKDLHRLSEHLASFDAFVCAYTALLTDLGRCQTPPKGYPRKSGWIQYPNLTKLGYSPK